VFSFDRYYLVQSLLAGDRDSRLVLADLLEEQGAIAVADFARRTRVSREGDLDLALRVVEPREALLLACDYLDHACGLSGGRPKYGWLLAQISGFRQRLHGGVDGAYCRAVRLRLSGFRIQPRWDRIVDHLDEAVHVLGRAVGAMFPDDERPDEVSIAVSAVARSLRQFRGRGNLDKQPKRQRQELEWQIKRTRQAIEERLEGRSGAVAPGIPVPARL
jgi:hypothetical protein